MVLTAAVLYPHPMELVPELATDPIDRWAAACRLPGRGRPVGHPGRRWPTRAIGGSSTVGGHRRRRPRNAKFRPGRSLRQPCGIGSLVEIRLGTGSRGSATASAVIEPRLLAAHRVATGEHRHDHMRCRFRSGQFDTSPQECLALGVQLAARAERVAFIVMGEGVTCVPPAHRTADLMESDNVIRESLEGSDTESLRRLGYATMTGRAPWQVLAGAADAAAFDTRTHGSAPHDALVISWRRQ